MSNKKYISVSELSRMLGLSRVAVYKKIKNGQIKVKHIAGKMVIPAEKLGFVLGKALSGKQKQTIQDAVKKVVEDYGDVLEWLGKEDGPDKAN